PAGDFAVDVDHTARVGDIVRCVKNSALLKLVTVSLFQQLIICSTRDYANLEFGYRRVIDDSTQRAWRENVCIGTENGVALDDRGAGELLHPRCLGGIDVGDDELCTGFVQLFRQIGSDAARPLDGD